MFWLRPAQAWAFAPHLIKRCAIGFPDGRMIMIDFRLATAD